MIISLQKEMDLFSVSNYNIIRCWVYWNEEIFPLLNKKHYKFR